MDGLEYLRLNQERAQKYPEYLRTGVAGFRQCISPAISEESVISIPGRHVFAGYYDIPNVAPDGFRLFFLSVAKDAIPQDDPADICLYDLRSRSWTVVAKTRAWCWQQGARVRWDMKGNDGLLFNDYDGTRYVTRRICLPVRTVAEFLPVPTYDINEGAGIAFTLNFDRLQRLRPGYGYACRGDWSADMSAPADDGLFRVDIRTKTSKLIFSLCELARQVSSNSGEHHYLNHVSLSPSGMRVMFFHLWASDPLGMWKMRLMVANADGTQLKALEDSDIVSHYAWIDDHRLLTTRLSSSGSCYVIYDVESGLKQRIGNSNLSCDGHPSVLANGHDFIADTYPLDNSLQHLFLADIDGLSYEPLYSAFSDPRFYIERRCDMHPRLNRTFNLINLDSTFSDGLRKVVVLRLKNRG